MTHTVNHPRRADKGLGPLRPIGFAVEAALVKRYAAYEFPEYVDWQPDPAVQAEFAARLTADPARAAHIAALDEAPCSRCTRAWCAPACTTST
jgi:hypothetical protein